MQQQAPAMGGGSGGKESRRSLLGSAGSEGMGGDMNAGYGKIF